MSSPTSPPAVRRSVAIPSALVDKAIEMAPERLRRNFNQLVRAALEEFVDRRKEEQFASDMQRMADDPEVQAEVRAIEREFAAADGDGL